MAKQNFYSELNLRKENINLQRIELKNIKVVQETFNNLEIAFEDLKYAKELAMDANQEASVLYNKASKVKLELEKLIEEAEDIETNTIQTQQFLDEKIDQAITAIDNADRNLPAFRKNAEDLGLDADVVDEYRDALKLTGILSASEQEATSMYNGLDDDIDNVKEISNIQL